MQDYINLTEPPFSTRNVGHCSHLTQSSSSHSGCSLMSPHLLWIEPTAASASSSLPPSPLLLLPYLLSQGHFRRGAALEKLGKQVEAASEYLLCLHLGGCDRSIYKNMCQVGVPVLPALRLSHGTMME